MKYSQDMFKPMTPKNLVNLNPTNLALIMIRPFFFISMSSYFFQMFAGFINIFNLVFETKVSKMRTAFNGISVFLSWLDLYTLTSTTRDTGIMSTAFMSVFWNVSE